MNSNAILQSDLLDILFENRNKLYGAYDLRKFYKNRLLTSIGIMVIGVVCFTSLSFLTTDKEDSLVTDEVWFGHVVPEVKDKPTKPKPPSPARKSPVAKKALPGLPIVSHDDRIDSIAEIDPLLPGEVVDKSSGITEEPGMSMPGGYESVEIVEQIKTVVHVPDVNTPIFHPDVMPEFPGGMTALKRFLERNLTNPRDLDQGERVTVRAKFVVGFDGKLKAFNVVEDGGALFNNEVIRVLKKMPDWIPGKANGRNVSVYYTIPVKFISVD